MSPGPYREGLTPAGSPGPCPRCSDTALEPRTAGQLAVAQCRSCRGMWIGGAGYLDIFFAADEDLVRLARADRASPPSRAASGEASCPACGALMEAQGGATGITVDVCARHGLWLDAGELGVLFGGVGDGEEPPGLLDRLARWFMRDGER